MAAARPTSPATRPLWRASSLALPTGFTFTRSGNGVVFEGSTFAGRQAVTKGTDVPRFEALAGDRQGLLIEGARTNLILRSAEFNDAAWGPLRVTVNSDTLLAPDGTTTADVMVEDTSVTTTHRVAQVMTALSRYGISAYVVDRRARDDGDVPQFLQLAFQGRQPGRVDAVVVGQEDLHGLSRRKPRN